MSRQTNRIKNITLSADSLLIKEARLTAQLQGSSLNEAFREWLIQFTKSNATRSEYESLMQGLTHVSSDKKFTREEMNER